ncbi:hypothetical protein GCM10009037_21740 [Halarchaeum grantii]|uniref:Glycosyltransferase 2-like domain-containing protein n=1 Tax=Halarchaeum grantii TaxID=1193105 RepID=A0A830EWV7_9EURY|nr:glycosyltransferase family 2 protein [Halarchaeum grantii]GGL37821.1 hypothetical protein GCM10009037_21740 [Halarchaeum grantii]
MTAASDDAVVVEKSVVSGGFVRPAIKIELRSSADTPVVVRFADRIPGGRYVATTEGDAPEPAWGRLAGGRLESTVSLGPGESLAVHYLLDADAAGPVSADELPAPELLHVGALERDAGWRVDPAIRWRSPDGGWVPLTLVDPSTQAGVTDPDAVPGPVVGSWAAHERAAGPSVFHRPTAGSPAVGVVATDAYADAVYRTVVRARAHGFETYVTYVGDPDAEVVRFAEQLGAAVVRPPDAAVGESDAERERARRRALSAAARANGHPGIVFQPRSCPRIDYGRTLDAFANDGWEVDAVPESDPQRVDHPNVLVGIPAYRAEATIGDVVREARRYADMVLVVEDGGGDRTAEVARDAGAVVVEHARNKGYGGALKTIFREAAARGADYTVTLDADGQHDPSDVPRLVAAQRTERADVVIGNRYMAGSETHLPAVRAVGLGVVNLLTNLSMGRFLPQDWIHDTQSGYRAYTLEAVHVLEGARDVGNGMWASTDILYALDREDFAFAEVPTTIRYDLEGTSTEGALEHGLGLVRNIVGVVEHTHPMVLVGLPGAMSVLLGSLLGVGALQRFLATGLVSVGFTIATAGFTVAGVLLLFTAVLIRTINTHPYFRPPE